MQRRNILIGVLSCFTIIAAGQSTKRNLSVREPLNDRTIEYPVEMERNYDELLTKWSNNVKYADNCRSNSDAAVTVSDSVYIKRLYSLPTKMELVFNSIVKDCIEMYAGRRRNQVSYMLGEGKYYFPLFEEALDKEGLPLELKYLPVIESALNPVARSRVGATGLWQFMASTGKMYDLEINSLVDERCDPKKSTAAAAKYLKDLYSIYSDWNLVIAAYNCGPGNVNKAIRRSGGQTDYWAIYPYLPRETRGYVPIFIAATYIMSYYSEHNICPAICNSPASMDSLTINKNLHFQQIADVINVPVEDLRKFNPQFRSDVIPGDYKGYSLNLPIHKLSAFIDNQDSIYTHRSQELFLHRKVAGPEMFAGNGRSTNTNTIVHKVKKGETLASVAKKYGVTSRQLKDWNGLSANRLKAGKRLTIYRPEPSKPKEVKDDSNVQLASKEEVKRENSAKESGSSTPQVSVSYYKVRKGDTWANIAKKQGVSVGDIKKWNKIKANKLVAGKQLRIEKIEYVEQEELVQLAEPEMSIVAFDSANVGEMIDDYLKKIEREDSSLPLIRIGSSYSTFLDHKKSDEAKIIYHKVKIGETITQIASRYNVSKKDIIGWNKLSSNNAKVGQRLMIRLPEEDTEGLEGVLPSNYNLSLGRDQ